MNPAAIYLCTFAAVASLGVSALAQTLAPLDSLKAQRCRAVASTLQARALQDQKSLTGHAGKVALHPADQATFRDITERTQNDLKLGETILKVYGAAPQPSQTMISEVSKLAPHTLSLEAELCQPSAKTALNTPPH